MNWDVISCLFLSQLRKVDGILREEVKDMPITIDSKENVFVKEAIEKGIEKGKNRLQKK